MSDRSKQVRLDLARGRARFLGTGHVAILSADREHYFRVQRDSDARPIFVRPAVREIAVDDNPFAALLVHVSDEIERRVQSRRERLRGSYRWALDFRFARALYRAQKAGKWRLPRFRMRRFILRLFAKMNAGVDRWLFSPEGNPTFDRLCYALFTFILLYLIAQILRG